MNTDRQMLEDQVAQGQMEVADLEAELDRLSKRVLELGDAAEARRREMRSSFRKKHEGRYADLDVVKSLAGYPAHHTVTIFGAQYRLSPPVQQSVAEVDRYSQTAAAELRPTTSESMLLMWLSAVGADGEFRDLKVLPPKDRLSNIRSLPEVILSKLAEECATLQTYLNVVLEEELGN